MSKLRYSLSRLDILVVICHEFCLCRSLLSVLNDPIYREFFMKFLEYYHADWPLKLWIDCNEICHTKNRNLKKRKLDAMNAFHFRHNSSKYKMYIPDYTTARIVLTDICVRLDLNRPLIMWGKALWLDISCQANVYVGTSFYGPYRQSPYFVNFKFVVLGEGGSFQNFQFAKWASSITVILLLVMCKSGSFYLYLFLSTSFSSSTSKLPFSTQQVYCFIGLEFTYFLTQYTGQT